MKLKSPFFEPAFPNENPPRHLERSSPRRLPLLELCLLPPTKKFPADTSTQLLLAGSRLVLGAGFFSSVVGLCLSARLRKARRPAKQSKPIVKALV
jgi:hypothetical protein